jgi:hypothetical protein
MRSIVGAVVLAASLLVLGAGMRGVAARKPEHAVLAFSCPTTSRAGGIVGSIKKVLHSKVYVGNRYVGVTPFDVASASSICTDTAGEAVFDFARSNRSTVCVALNSTVVQVTPTVSVTTSFQQGATWCSIQPKDGSFSSPTQRLQLRAKRQALVGVSVTKRSAVVKVVEGSVSLSTRVRPHPVTVSSRSQRLVSSGGLIKKGEPLALSAEERVAIAQLRVARPTAG